MGAIEAEGISQRLIPRLGRGYTATRSLALGVDEILVEVRRGEERAAGFYGNKEKERRERASSSDAPWHDPPPSSMMRASKGASHGIDETTPASTMRRRMRTMLHKVKREERREWSIQQHVEREHRSSEATLSSILRVL